MFSDSLFNKNFINWGLGIGDWGLGIGPNPPTPKPKPPLIKIFL